MTEAPIIADRVSHSYGEGALREQVLFEVSTVLRAGEIVILMGPSGSGKTTFLTLIGGLRSTQSGSLRVLGHELRDAEEATLTEVRRNIGFIFQSHNLVQALTARQNVEIALQLHKELSVSERRSRAERMLARVGLGEHLHKFPNELSGGERQRVAIARALVGIPRIVLADEPTGALDRVTGREVVSLIHRLAREEKATVLLVTHDNRILDMADRILSMDDGRLSSLMRAMTSQTERMIANLTRDVGHGELVRRTQELDRDRFSDLLGEATGETQDLLAVMEAARQKAVEVMQPQLLGAFAAKVGEMLEAEATVYLVDHEAGELWSVGSDKERARELTLALGEGVAGRAADTGKTLMEDGTLCLPVADGGGQVFAVVELGGREFSPGDEERLTEFTRPLGAVLESWCRIGCACRRAEPVSLGPSATHGEPC